MRNIGRSFIFSVPYDLCLYIHTFAAGNLFGVSLSTLLLRDSQLTSEENNIPLVFQKILNELTKRGVKEEGILRVGGHKQKVRIFNGK